MNTTRRGLFGWLAGTAAAAVVAPALVQAAVAETPVAKAWVAGDWNEDAWQPGVYTGDGSHSHAFLTDELPSHTHSFRHA
jgi:hypothetical protein